MRNKLQFKKYYVPSSIWYLTLVSVAIYIIVSLAVFIFLSIVKEGLSFADRLLYFSSYCIGYVDGTGNGILDLVLNIVKVFFFAAIVTLFYELYKSIVEHRRIKIVEKAIYNNFLWTSSRASGTEIKYVPWFKTFGHLKTKFGYTEKEILDACKASQRLRVVNLATTQPTESYPADKLAVECYMRNTSYGCKIQRNSPVTIVVASTSFGLSKFGFYLSLFGGFNFISKENLEYDSSERYFSIDNDMLSDDSEISHFIDDANQMSTNQKKSWVIVLATMVYREGDKIVLYHSEQNTERYQSVCELMPDQILGVKIENNSDEFRVKRNNILNRIQSFDGFVMRISNKLVWNPAKIGIIKQLAEHLCNALGIDFNDAAVKDLSRSREKWMVGFPNEYFKSYPSVDINKNK